MTKLKDIAAYSVLGIGGLFLINLVLPISVAWPLYILGAFLVVSGDV